MHTILVVGAESVVGANLSAHWAESFRVVALSPVPDLSIAGCRTIACAPDEPEAARQWTASVRPGHIVFCGAAAHSTWQNDDEVLPKPRDVNAARNWARVASEFDARLTVISSDAVFTGPWMFHREDSHGLCPSDAARVVRQIEQDCCRLCPETLIVRTNAYGWTPHAIGPGWIERTLDALAAGSAGPYDYLRHATPIPATNLAELLVQAWNAGLNGEYHIAGAERTSPGRFVERLADHFQLPPPRVQPLDPQADLPTGYGRGESSLHTGKIRKALGAAMPNIAEGLSRLREQRDDRYQDRLNAPLAVHENVA